MNMQATRRLMRCYTEADEAFMQSIVIPEEERKRLTSEPWCGGGYRWFRAGNVVCLEWYRRDVAELDQKVA
jgi:hypothetical protein